MPTHLVDFATFRPPPEDESSALDNLRDPVLHEWGKRHGIGMLRPEYNSAIVQFMSRSGIRTGFAPKWLYPSVEEPPMQSFDDCMREIMRSMCGAVDLLLSKTGLAPRDVDIVVTTMSTFHSIPSSSALLVNHYKMKSGVLSYSLCGQGCSMGAICINLIDDLLKAHPNSNALLVTTECTTAGFYTGQAPDHMIPNLLFREGAAAVLLSNKRSQALVAKYQLLHSVRVHTGASDRACASMAMANDGTGAGSVRFNADTPWAAKDAIERVVKKIAPRIMSWSQLAAAAVNLAQRRWYGAAAVPAYAPCFADCVDHFALHPGNYGMLRGFMKGLRLPPSKVLPSFAALRDYGNTSASSTYYVLAYLEGVGGGVRRGQTVMQLGVGSGAKAGVNVWRALRHVRDDHLCWQHLHGVPVTEADLPLPISGSRGEGGGNDGGGQARQMADIEGDLGAFYRATAAAAAAAAATSGGGGSNDAASETA